MIFKLSCRESSCEMKNVRGCICMFNRGSEVAWLSRRARGCFMVIARLHDIFAMRYSLSSRATLINDLALMALYIGWVCRPKIYFRTVWPAEVTIASGYQAMQYWQASPQQQHQEQQWLHKYLRLYFGHHMTFSPLVAALVLGEVFSKKFIHLWNTPEEFNYLRLVLTPTKIVRSASLPSATCSDC